MLIIAIVLMLNGCQTDQTIGPDDTGESLDKGKPKFKIQLSGENEVPSIGDQDGSGDVLLFVNERDQTVTFEISVSNILLPSTGAHIHNAVAGVNGPVVVALIPPDESGYSSGVVQVNDSALLQAIKLNPKNYYVNVHNADYPAGAIRGQLK
jgi:hypothetical protein